MPIRVQGWSSYASCACVCVSEWEHVCVIGITIQVSRTLANEGGDNSTTTTIWGRRDIKEIWYSFLVQCSMALMANIVNRNCSSNVTRMRKATSVILLLEEAAGRIPRRDKVNINQKSLHNTAHIWRACKHVVKDFLTVVSYTRQFQRDSFHFNSVLSCISIYKGYYHSLSLLPLQVPTLYRFTENNAFTYIHTHTYNTMTVLISATQRLPHPQS